MNGRDCDSVRDLLPELAAGTMAQEQADLVEAHLSSCPDCMEELELIRVLLRAKPGVPQGLEARIQARVREEMGRERLSVAAGGSSVSTRISPIFAGRRVAPSWFLSAAAVVILALGTGVIWSSRAPDLVQDPTVVASQEPLPEAWLWDDGMIAGAPVFDGLSDEDLEALLKEFEG